MKTNPITAFYGYHEAVICKVCLISRSYAKRLKNGTAKPSRQVLELFNQYAEQRTPGPEWKGWRFHKGFLYTPEDKKISQGDIRALPYLLQLQAEITRVRQGRHSENGSNSSNILVFRLHHRLDRKPLDKKSPSVPGPKHSTSNNTTNETR